MLWITSRIAAGIAGVLLVFSVGASAQEAGDKNARPTIRVTGEASVSTKPDQALIDIGVTTQSATAQAAASENATKLDAVLSELRKALGANAEIKTVNYSVTPSYRYPREGGQPTITGYTASNIVRVKTGDLAQVGKIIDLATQTGANTIHALRFTLKDELNVRNQALREASSKAMSQAVAIASALNLKIVRVLHVESGGEVGPRPMYYAAAEARVAGAAPTPVEPGTLDVSATVVLTVEVSQ